MAQEESAFNTTEIIKEMQLVSDSKDLIPLTVRIESDFYMAMGRFCEAMDIKKSVMLRRLMQIGWEIVTRETEYGKDS